MNQNDLNLILENHKKWLGTDFGEKADLHGANLHGANLQEVNLRRADLHGTDLYGANLCRADLHGANLRGANLQEADLRGADLQEVSLRRADLQGADLHGANLYRADLRGANLDFSVFPLWCGTRKIEVSISFVYQLLAHICCLKCVDSDFNKIEKLIFPFAVKFRRANDLGLLDN